MHIKNILKIVNIYTQTTIWLLKPINIHVYIITKTMVSLKSASVGWYI